MRTQQNRQTWAVALFVLAPLAVLLIPTGSLQARQNIRDAFFTVYSDAVGSPIDTVPSRPSHCGVCHFDFAGGGARNPYGLAVEAALPGFPSNPNGRRQAIISVQNIDSDGDGFTTLVEVADTVNYTNTPTFPGLTPANVQNVSNVLLTEIQPYLVPMSGADTTPPTVTVLSPNGGETLIGNTAATVLWQATDASGISRVDLLLSDDGGLTFRTLAEGIGNAGTYTWFPPNRPTLEALVRIVAIDNAFNTGYDTSDAFFTIVAPPGGLAPTTLRDFDMPGSQPFESGILNPPSACVACHGNYAPLVEPYATWQGSMMSQASRDPLFEACMAIANQDAPDSGDLCLRCHLPRGWLRGRSVPTDGSQMLVSDQAGVACDLCHRLVDPFYMPGQNPPEDLPILNALSLPPMNFGNGMFIVDPTGARRGPFPDATSGHPILVSPFHREAALCGTCHDVSNTAFEKDGFGNYVPNEFDAPAASYSANTLMPIERTYSEWFHSEYNTLQGVYAPQFGGNKAYVATCQDCHMRDVTGKGCNFAEAPVRTDLPLHDMTGGSTWLPGLLPSLYPDLPTEVNATNLQAGVLRARYMLQNAAVVESEQQGSQLWVRVTNDSGHKLPTGYPEGRRMWINVRFYDNQQTLVGESGAYDFESGMLSHDAQAKIYEAKPGLDEVTAPLVGVEPGPSFHFVLNNKIFKDNRIPPRGFTNDAFAGFGGSPVGHAYADGQYWDDTHYAIPAQATSAVVILYYQSTSKEYIEFLRDENITNDAGQQLYDLWANNGRCPPEVMATLNVPIALAFGACCFQDGHCEPLTEDDCTAAGGVSWTIGLSCEPNPCMQPTGACCFQDGHCEQLTEDDCTTAGGASWTMGLSCEPNPCMQPTGACCFQDGHCEQLTEDDCTATGGVSWTMGLSCEPNPCILRGDLNCDGMVNFGDINPFVLYLSNYSAWAQTYPDCPPENGDINGDGDYPSFGDINPFVALLSGGA